MIGHDNEKEKMGKEKEKPTGTVRRFPSGHQLSYACHWQGLVSWTHGG